MIQGIGRRTFGFGVPERLVKLLTNAFLQFVNNSVGIGWHLFLEVERHGLRLIRIRLHIFISRTPNDNSASTFS